jgi:AAA+ ATPase superfamily predicted ATPase
MVDLPFIGREEELRRLNDLLKRKTATLAVIKGRRRIGKSRLCEEFAKGKRFLQFSGLPPVKKVTAQAQRNEFSRLLSQQTGLPELQPDDWSKLFTLLG